MVDGDGTDRTVSVRTLLSWFGAERRGYWKGKDVRKALQFSAVKIRLSLSVLLCCLAISACDTDRVDKLEKENAELKAKIEQQSAAANFELQAKCSKDAKSWFGQNWSPEKTTILLNYTNHYNTKQNKCFILVEHHNGANLPPAIGFSWANIMVLYDVYENAEYAHFSENHYTYYKPRIRNGDEVVECDVGDQKCKTGDEFNNLVRPYMSE